MRVPTVEESRVVSSDSGTQPLKALLNPTSRSLGPCLDTVNKNLNLSKGANDLWTLITKELQSQWITIQ